MTCLDRSVRSNPTNILNLRLRHGFRIASKIVAIAALCFVGVIQSFADDSTKLATLDVQRNDDKTFQITNIQIGINQVWKVGYPSRFAFDLLDVSWDSMNESLGTAVISTVDGEGVGVDCEVPMSREQCFPVEVAGQKRIRFETTVVHGRANRPISLAIQIAGSDETASLIVVGPKNLAVETNGKSLSINQELRGKVLPATQPWVVGIGSDLKLDQVAQQSAQGRLPSYVNTEIPDGSLLPSYSQAYNGIDLLVLPTSPSDVIDSMTAKQQIALRDWVRMGGHLQVWAGANANRIPDWGWLRDVLPARVQGVAPESDPGTIEAFLTSQVQLGRLTLGRFTVGDGLVDLIDRTKLPLIIRGAYGLGQVQICAADLNQEPLVSWPDRKLLLEKLLLDSIDSPRKIQTGSSSQVALVGYDDMAGQLRSFLDDFPSVQSGNLLAVAAVVALLVALIGPLDYFVIQRILQKPTWTWWSLGLWSTITLGVVIGLVQWWKPDRELLNSIEIVDFDYATRSIKGSAFMCQYVGKSGRYDLEASNRQLIARTPELLSEAEQKKYPISLNWFGQPGSGLGGFDSNVRTDFGFPSYRLTANSSLDRLGIPTSGTKALRAEWSVSELPEWPKSSFEVAPGSDFLQGSWMNPLSDDVLEPILIYSGWVYRLPSKIRSGSSISILSADIPKDLGRYLQQRQSVKDSETGQPWDPSSSVSAVRLFEMLGFHRAAGGMGYTGLSHRYLKNLDFSQLAYLNRAIILGRIEEPIASLALERADEKLVVRNANRNFFVRFVLPVEQRAP
jgi:hypothetical protein